MRSKFATERGFRHQESCVKHPRFKGIGTLYAEIEKCEKDLLNKENEFKRMFQKLSFADPSLDDVNRLR